MSVRPGLVPEIKPGEALDRLDLLPIQEESVFAAGEEVEVLPMTVDGKPRNVVGAADSRLGAILDDAVEDVDFKASVP